MSKENLVISDADFDALIRRIWTTKACRFNCHARLAKEHRFSSIVFALLSLGLIAISTLSLIDHFDETNVRPDLMALILSIILLVVGLVDSQDNKSVVSERMHRSALELLELYNLAMVSKKSEEAKVAVFKEYSEIQRRYIDNHHTIDFNVVKLGKASEFGLSWIDRMHLISTTMWLKFKIFMFPDGVAIICLTILLFMAFLPAVQLNV
jgi:hypothetical protein